MSGMRFFRLMLTSSCRYFSYWSLMNFMIGCQLPAQALSARPQGTAPARSPPASQPRPQPAGARAWAAGPSEQRPQPPRELPSQPPVLTLDASRCGGHESQGNCTLAQDLGAAEGSAAEQAARQAPAAVRVLLQQWQPQGSSPVLIVDVVPKARRVDDRELHADALLLNICRITEPTKLRGRPWTATDNLG